MMHTFLSTLCVMAATLLAGAAQSDQAPVPRVLTESEFRKAMQELQSLDKRLRENIEEVARADLERMLLFEATMTARADAARIEEIMADIGSFWRARKVNDAASLSNDALMEAGNISKALAIIDLNSPSVATHAQTRLDKICMSCHAIYRERLPDGTFRIKEIK
jgi:hypothetical protein